MNNKPPALRMTKTKFTTEVVTRQLWMRFTSEYPEHSKLSFKDFIKVWDEIAEIIVEQSCLNPLGVKLGSYIGEIKVQYLPYKFYAKDWNTSRIIEKDVPYLNINQKGKVAVVKWERRWASRFNKMLQFYGFAPHSRFRKLANKAVTEDPGNIRVSRVTLGGRSNFWTRKRNNI